MAGQSTIEFTEANFEAEALGSDVPVLVDFWAEWCMPCKMLAPTIDQLAEQFQGKAKVGKVDTDAHKNLAVNYEISAIPTVVLLKGGQVVNKFIGMTGKDELAAAIQAAM